MSTHQFSNFAGSSEPMPKSLFGYDVIDYIGQGAGSLIYVVSEPRTNQLYALKHVVRKTEKDGRFIEQLEAEFQVSRTFQHPGLRRSIDLKENRTVLRKVTDAALIMELFDGAPLDTNRPTSLVTVCSIFIQTAKAMEALHQMGFIHCDLKPNNIMVGTSEEVKVIDFGQACKAGTIKERIQGTPDYISPEQVKCEGVTVKTDIFNFGATLYWALTGQKIPTAFTVKRGENSFLLDDKIPTPHELNASVPEPLSNLAMECVRTNPAKRPATMADVARRLEVMHHSLMRRAANNSGSSISGLAASKVGVTAAAG